QTDAGRPKPGIVRRPWNLRPKFRRELAPDRRNVDAHFLEYPAMHRTHDSPAAAVAGPGFSFKPAGGMAGLVRAFILDRLEGRAKTVAQGLEPEPRGVAQFLVLGVCDGFERLPDHRGLFPRASQSTPEAGTGPGVSPGRVPLGVLR